MTQSIDSPVISHPARLAYADVAPGTMAALSALQSAVNKSGLEKATVELAKLRASQINGCSFCLDMHFRDAVAASFRKTNSRNSRWRWLRSMPGIASTWPSARHPL